MFLDKFESIRQFISTYMLPLTQTSAGFDATLIFTSFMHLKCKVVRVVMPLEWKGREKKMIEQALGLNTWKLELFDDAPVTSFIERPSRKSHIYAHVQSFLFFFFFFYRKEVFFN